ncbi:hypothetical protein NC651_040254 [Populus alba x Populus x berolinensis]|nr:hypothetical protein NC651_040254 [Populus alba x Populus x berolinensis]
MCVRACNTCCKRCDCVPPGSLVTKIPAPCYANMTTHGDRHKFP